MAVRAWNAIIALLVLVAFVVQLVIAVRVSGVPAETSTGLLRGASTAGRIVRVLSFFTIESNLLCGVVSFVTACRPSADGRVLRALRLAALVGITVTGIVYSAVLADVHEPKGPAETLVNTLVHYVVPAATVLGWLLLGPRRHVDRAAVAGAFVFPLVWLAYSLLRGAIWNWYPYPFLDAQAHGYVATVLNAVAVAVVFVLVILLMAAIENKLLARRRPDRTAGAA